MEEQQPVAAGLVGARFELRSPPAPARRSNGCRQPRRWRGSRRSSRHRPGSLPARCRRPPPARARPGCAASVRSALRVGMITEIMAPNYSVWPLPGNRHVAIAMNMFLLCSTTSNYISDMSIALRKAPDSESFPLETGGVAAGRRHGRGAQTNRSGRYEPVAYEPVDDGWESLGELDALATEVRRCRPGASSRATNPRYRLRPLDQSLSRLRAWLHLLLRAADPRLSRAVARARFRDQAVRQDQCRRGADAGAGRSRAIRSAPSPSAPIPTPISRSSGATASCAASSKC